MLTNLFLLILSIIWIIGVYYLSFAFITKLRHKESYVPFIPIDKRGLEEISKYVELKESDNVIDIGSGWGSIVFFFAKLYPKTKFCGIELNPILHFIALIRKILFKQNYKNVNLICKDAVIYNYSNYNVIFLFMLPKFIQGKLIHKLESELTKGAKVISYVFPVETQLFDIKEIVLPYSDWRNKLYICTKL